MSHLSYLPEYPQKNLLTHKINLKSITDIASSNFARGMDVSSFECWVLSGTHFCDELITISDEIYNHFVCVSVLTC
jgi:hypothetical protein